MGAGIDVPTPWRVFRGKRNRAVGIAFALRTRMRPLSLEVARRPEDRMIDERIGEAPFDSLESAIAKAELSSESPLKEQWTMQALHVGCLQPK